MVARDGLAVGSDAARHGACPRGWDTKDLAPAGGEGQGQLPGCYNRGMEPSLLAAVIDNPTDDDLRLVFADWLEENGEEDRGAFIRVQIELAQGPRSYRECWKNQPKIDAEVRRMDGLRRREQELQELHGDTWALPLALAAGFKGTPMYGAANGRDSLGNPRYHHICSEYASDMGRRLAWTFRRGFVESIETDTKTFLAHGATMVACQPLERVTLTGLQPNQSQMTGRFGWWDESSEKWGRTDEVPGEIARNLPDSKYDDDFRARGWTWYTTREAAMDALSLAALTWARDRQAAQCPECGGDGIREVDTGGNVWQSPCPDCAGTGKRGGRAADMPRPEQSAARTPS